MGPVYPSGVSGFKRVGLDRLAPDLPNGHAGGMHGDGIVALVLRSWEAGGPGTRLAVRAREVHRGADGWRLRGVDAASGEPVDVALVDVQEWAGPAPRSVPARGVYRHYKGRYYWLVDVATHSETEEQLAVYRCLYGDYSLWARPLGMFTEQVPVDGVEQPRFAYVGPVSG